MDCTGRTAGSNWARAAAVCCANRMMRVHCAQHGLKDVIPAIVFNDFHQNWRLEFRISRSKTIQRLSAAQ